MSKVPPSVCNVKYAIAVAIFSMSFCRFQLEPSQSIRLVWQSRSPPAQRLETIYYMWLQSKQHL